METCLDGIAAFNLGFRRSPVATRTSEAYSRRRQNLPSCRGICFLRMEDCDALLPWRTSLRDQAYSEEERRKQTSRSKSLGDDDLNQCVLALFSSHSSLSSLNHLEITPPNVDHNRQIIIRCLSSRVCGLRSPYTANVTSKTRPRSSTIFRRTNTSRLDLNDHLYSTQTLICGNVSYIVLPLLSPLIPLPSPT